MIVEPLIVPALIATAAIGGVSLLLNVIGSTVYDIRQAKARQHYNLQPHARLYRHRPLVSIIIPTHNDESVIERCLDSIRFSEYRKFQIIIIDDRSSDTTCDVVKQWMAAHPKRAVRLIANRKPSSYLSRLRTVSRRHLHGKIVMVLEPSSRLAPETLTRAVRQFNYQPALDLLLPNRRPSANLTVASLLERYANLLGQRRQKWDSVARADYTPVTEAIIYRTASFREILHLHRKLQPAGRLLSLPMLRSASQYQYANDIVVYTSPSTSLRDLAARRYQLHLSRWQALVAQHQQLLHPRRCADRLWLPLAAASSLLAVLVPFLVGYFIYLAVALHEPLLLGLSAAILAGLLLTAIWSDQSLKLRQKLTYIIGIPTTYALFYLSACLQLLMIFPLLLRRKKLLTNNSPNL